MKTAILFTAVAVLAGAAAPTNPAPSAGEHATAANAAASKPSCFRTQDMGNHTFVGDHTMYVRVRLNEVYQVETSGRCLAGHSSFDPIVIDPSPPSGLICRPLDLSLKVGHQGAGGLMPAPCIVDSIRKLTPAEIAALPPKQRP